MRDKGLANRELSANAGGRVDAPRPRRGRPIGRTTAVLAAARPLRQQHFGFLRAWAEGIDPARAWQRYLAHADDESQPPQARQIRRLLREVRLAAGARGLAHESDLALRGLGRAVEPVGAAPAIPALADWIEQRCAEMGIDPDFLPQSEWLAEYEAEFAGATVAAAARPRQARGRFASIPVRERLRALATLESALARPPSLEDPLAAWLAPSLVATLERAGVRTIGELIAWVNRVGYRWHRRIDGLGARRALRVLDWLAPVARQLSAPLQSHALTRMTFLTAARSASRMDATMPPLAPLDRLSLPSGLEGRGGALRHPQSPWTSDLDAVRAWANGLTGADSTRGAYQRAVERLLLWCTRVQGRALSELRASDISAHLAFLSAPPADWVQERRAARAGHDWRPLRGALSASSLRVTTAALTTLIADLVDAGHLRAEALELMRTPPAPKPAPQRVGLDEPLWQWIAAAWLGRYARCGPTRTARSSAPAAGGPFSELLARATAQGADRQPAVACGLRRSLLAMTLCQWTGWRLSELLACVAVNPGDPGAIQISIPAEEPGPASRSAALPPELQRLVLRHWRDLDKLRPSSLRSGGSVFGPLRARPRRWALDVQGAWKLESSSGEARWGASLDASALAQSVKRLLIRASEMADAAGASDAAQALRGASMDWLRRGGSSIG